jgi:hypothetical protein
MDVTILGVDLAKNLFALCGADAQGASPTAQGAQTSAAVELYVGAVFDRDRGLRRGHTAGRASWRRWDTRAAPQPCTGNAVPQRQQD